MCGRPNTTNAASAAKDGNMQKMTFEQWFEELKIEAARVGCGDVAIANMNPDDYRQLYDEGETPRGCMEEEMRANA